MRKIIAKNLWFILYAKIALYGEAIQWQIFNIILHFSRFGNFISSDVITLPLHFVSQSILAAHFSHIYWWFLRTAITPLSIIIFVVMQIKLLNMNKLRLLCVYQILCSTVANKHETKAYNLFSCYYLSMKFVRVLNSSQHEAIEQT